MKFQKLCIHIHHAKDEHNTFRFKDFDFEDKSLLIVDDDDPFRDRLSRAMEKKGFSVKSAKSVDIAINLIKSSPGFAVVDLRLDGGNGLDVVKQINLLKKDSRIVMLTGYGNIPTTVAAIKAGAIDYMAKPVDADDVEAALLAEPILRKPQKTQCQLTG